MKRKNKTSLKPVSELWLNVNLIVMKYDKVCKKLRKYEENGRRIEFVVLVQNIKQ